MWNAGRVPARLIEIITPPGFEDFLRELADLNAAGADLSEHLGELGDRYGQPFPQPDWLPGIVARYGLSSATRWARGTGGEGGPGPWPSSERRA